VEDYSVIEDNLNQGGLIYNSRWTAYLGSSSTNLWHYGIVALTDQHITVDGLYAESGNAFRAATTEWTPWVILGPGPSGVNNSNAAALLQLNNSYLSAANCVDWQSANDLHVSNTLCQDSPSIGFRISNRRGAFGTAQIHGTHIEMACNNPFGNIGCTGIQSNGMELDWDGVTSGGGFPRYAAIGNGLTLWFYYVQPKNSTSDTLCTTTQPNDQRCQTGPGTGNWGTGPVLPVGYAQVDSSTFGSPTISWPPVLNATSYNLYKVTVPANGVYAQPFGTGNFGVATALNPATVCTDNVCTFTDTTGNSPSSVTIPVYQAGVTNGPNYWGPYITFWPGTVFAGVSNDAGGPSQPNSIFCTKYRGTYPSIFTYVASPLSGGCWTFTSPPSIGSTSPPVPGVSPPIPAGGTATSTAVGQLWPSKPGITTSDGGLSTGLKGVFNFGTWPALTLAYPIGIITWQDSNYYKTYYTNNNHPAADAGDTATWLDQSGGYAVSAGTAHSWYLNAIPNSGATNWAMRLNSSGLTLANESANAGQAACFTTGGLVGHCTSAVNSSGSCTCVNP
jgi:hypothetical protein